MSDVYYMNLAIKEARRAVLIDEVPIGAIVVWRDKVIATCYNRKEKDKIATAHAEVLAINAACRYLDTWRLDECVLYTTVEPCMMCTGAIIQSRISKVVYGAKNEAFGYLSKLENSKIEVIGGVLASECASILSCFFQKQR